MRILVIAGLVLTALMLAGCSDKPAAPRKAQALPTMERAAYKSWPEAYRLSNGEFELIAVPAVGRVMRYGPVGGPNLLWENPKTPSGEGWKNWGGDRLAIWPQDDWTKHFGGGWPPPKEMDGLPWEVRLDGAAVVMTSPVVPGFGVRIVRRFELAATGSEVTTKAHLEPVAGAAVVPAAAWEITQVAVPSSISAHLVKTSTLEHGYKSLWAQPWEGIKTDNGVLVLPASKVECKVGIDADRLDAYRIVVTPSGSWSLALRATAVEAERFTPGERCQIYSCPEYVELEFTAPVVKTERGPSPELTVIWSAKFSSNLPPP